MESSNPRSSRTDRKTMERNRRNQMKFLFSRLYSLVPHQTSRDSVPLPDQLDEAMRYIKKLQINGERLKEKRDNLLGLESLNRRLLSSGMDITRVEPVSPRIDIHMTGSGLEINLVTGSSCHQSMFNEVIRVLNEEGVEIVNASFSVVGGVAYHMIHAYKDTSYKNYDVLDLLMLDFSNLVFPSMVSIRERRWALDDGECSSNVADARISQRLMKIVDGGDDHFL